MISQVYIFTHNFLIEHKLTHFHFSFCLGRAEPIRNAFKIGKIAFDDKRITFQEFGANKATYNWGSVPVLKINDKVTIAQSNAILRYAGGQAGLIPKDPIDAARVDEFLGVGEDLTQLLSASFSIKDEDAKKAAREAIVKDKFPAWFANLERYFLFIHYCLNDY